MLRLYYQSYDDRLPPRFVDEHEEIIAAVASRDVVAADRLGKAHGEQIVEQIGRLLTRNDRLDIDL
jgi:DNA-binding GntR family transcriptional regulator